jgi:hypothetical protein
MHQQLFQSSGAAQELCREVPPLILVQGGPINGVQTDPLTYIMHLLAENCAQLGEEVRISSLTELLSFRRRAGEMTDEFLTRFDAVHMRAVQIGQLDISPKGMSWMLLKVVGVSDSQLLHLLQPLGNQLPNTPQQYRELLQRIRRMAHVMEHRPNNIAQSLRRPHDSAPTLCWANAETRQSDSAHAYPAWSQSADRGLAGATIAPASFWSAGPVPHGGCMSNTLHRAGSPRVTIGAGMAQIPTRRHRTASQITKHRICRQPATQVNCCSMLIGHTPKRQAGGADSLPSPSGAPAAS